MTIETNKAVVQRYIDDVINQGKLDVIDTLFSPEMRESVRGFATVANESFPSPYYARHQRQYLLKAGFARTEGFVFAVGGSNPHTTPFMYKMVLKPTIESLRLWITERGLADDAGLGALLVKAQAWSERPDAFFALKQCAAVA